MHVSTKVSFFELTTFHIGGPAAFYTEIENIEELREAVSFAQEKNLPVLILGGGSNMLVSDKGFDGLVIHPKLKGFAIDGETVSIAAGENWDECAQRIVDAGLWGTENLSFVPGDVAGLAIQNVGAYGQEARSVITSVDVYDTISNSQFSISNDECKFGYRKSIFNVQKGRYVVLGLTLKLSKNGEPNTTYGLKPGTLQEMRDQVIAIRKSKGQDPSEYWSAGSFFKNPIITEEQYAKLPAGAPGFRTPLPPYGKGETEGVKVPAGYLLDKVCDLKGLTVGGAKLSELQVINIINFNNATADDVLTLFKKARDIVYQKTGIMLENEPELVGF